LIFLPFVSAGSVGISPTNFNFFFEPNLEKTFDFTVTSADAKTGIEVYVAGDLAQYVKLSENYFIGRGNVKVSLKLPEYIEIPGKHRILIGVKESSKNVQKGSGIGGVAAVQAVIDVYVPYPGKYIEAEFDLKNINKGENAPFELIINNLGTEKITINPKIEIYERESKLKSKIIEIGELQSKESKVIKDFLDTSDLKEGIYKVFVTMDYGKVLTIEKELKVGHFFLNITDYSYEFIEGKINQFNIIVENLWNSKIEGIFAEVSISDKGIILDDFRTPSINLNPWTKENLTGFFDATNISKGRYTANLRVFYGNKTTSKLVAIYVYKKKLNKMWFIFGGIIIGTVTLLFVMFIYLIIKIRRLKKDVKKIKKQS